MRHEKDDLRRMEAALEESETRAEELLRRSEARFRALFERAGEGILIADMETRRFRYANPEMCRMLGYSIDEILALGVEDIHPAEDLPTVLDTFARQSRGELVNAPLLRSVRKDGSILDVAIASVPIELDGRPCLAGFFRDETIRRQLEEERLRAQKLEAVGLLAGGIAHDFNNLLQGIFGFLSVARRRYDRREECLGALAEAEETLSTAVGLTSQLLTFARGGQPVKRVFAVAPVVHAASRLALAGGRSRARLELESDLWAVEGDQGQVSQVVHNLVVNADQAMPAGGEIAVRARNVRAPGPDVPATLRAGGYLEVSIQDEGVGIRPQDLPRVFDPYFTTKERGNGLGLAAAYSIVRHHGGLIDVRSTVGTGSLFRVFLPAATREAAPSARRPTPTPGLPARVLLMDDDECVRKATARLLESLGHTVAVAEDGAVAARLFREARLRGTPFDVVILDLTVRGAPGGLEALVEIRLEAPDVKAIVSSGYSDEAALSDHRRYGFVAGLPKPYTIEDLDRTLREALGG